MNKMDIWQKLEEKNFGFDWCNWILIFDTFKLIFMAALLTLRKFVSVFITRKEKSLKDEVILITGSANGLGKELCFQLASEGATLVLWDIAADENARVARELRDMGVKRVIESTVDVSDRNAVKDAAIKLRYEVGPATVLINNAGVAPMQPFFQMKPETIQKTFGVNVLSQFWTLQEFLPDMIKMNKGHIVTICSTMGLEPVRGCSPYVASKHASHGFIECMKHELHHLGNCENIKFTTVYPFFFKTKMVDEDCGGLRLKFKFPSWTPFMEVGYVAKNILHAVKCEQESLILPHQYLPYLKLVYPFMPREVHSIVQDYAIEELEFVNSSNTEIKGFSSDDKRRDKLLTNGNEPTSKSF